MTQQGGRFTATLHCYLTKIAENWIKFTHWKLILTKHHGNFSSINQKKNRYTGSHTLQEMFFELKT